MLNRIQELLNRNLQEAFGEATPRDRGMLIGFPSYGAHRVTPVTAGIRKSLVIWTTGPQFR